MRKFSDGELNALEFAQEISERILEDREEASNLVEDFQNQANIKPSESKENLAIN